MSQDGHDGHGNMSMPMPMPSTPSSPGYDMPTGSMGMKDMVMHMSFFWGKDVTVLFEGWPDGRLGMYILALALVFFLAFAVEILSIPPTTVKPGGRSSPVAGALSHAVVYALRMLLAYSVMLAVMSFNIGILIVAVAGHAVGMFVVKLRALSGSSGAGPTASNADKF